ncbi:MAG: co-chaperone DjlA [Proteobacteria bacterium]|nr:co-chaperone DjlA [Pseudomonadota bacterium]
MTTFLSWDSMWIGKLLGGLFGFLITKSPIGLLFGVVIGHYFDQGLRLNWQGMYFGYTGPEQKKIRQAFFKITFSVMGHVAKSDGRVSESEIRAARGIMTRLRLNAAQKRQAIDFFNEGKQSDFDLTKALDQLKQACHSQKILLQMFVEIQFQVALAEGARVGPHKKKILETICQKLGFAPMFARFGDFGSGARGQSYYQHAGAQHRPVNRLKEAYDLLGIDEKASESEIKRAYRKLMSQNHPDKLIAKGLPEAMIRMATDKTQKIQAAYELVRESKGIA